MDGLLSKYNAARRWRVERAPAGVGSRRGSGGRRQVNGKRRRNGRPVDDKDKKSFVGYEE